MSASAEEKRAAVFVLVLLIVGVGVRLLLHQAGAPGNVLLRPSSDAERSDRDSLAARSERLARPLRRGERVDVDTADLQELTRLPRIGPVLASRIVADREEHGAYGSLESLSRVSGIGPRILEGLAPHVQFSGTARSLPNSSGRRGRLSLNSATVDELSTLPGIGETKARAIVEYRSRFGRFSSVDALVEVPGIGPATLDRVRPMVRVP